MTTPVDSPSLSNLARLGFRNLSLATQLAQELSDCLSYSPAYLLDGAELAANPDSALRAITEIARIDHARLANLFKHADSLRRTWQLLGASEGLGDFFRRHPEEIGLLAESTSPLPSSQQMKQNLLQAVGEQEGFARSGEEKIWTGLRVQYRRELVRIACYDLATQFPTEHIGEVTRTLADAAGAALWAALAIARMRVLGRYERSEVALTRLSVIGMGKAGARELNYVSDVDVIFVAGTIDDSLLPEQRAIDIATQIARETVRVLSDIAQEPPLWEVDTALRPEGEHGALVRSLSSHLAYYQRWAKSWEFQALMKARFMAGDEALGQEYIAAIHEQVWSSAAREDFVESVRAMRERVTEHLTPQQAPHHIKLGSGGIRDIEFTVQLLQLVHGLTDPSVRTRGTLESIEALMVGGYIGRADAQQFAQHYRTLRLLEHRLQLQHMRRTHLMPTDEEDLRVLARATGLAPTGPELKKVWEHIRQDVRSTHVRIFYRPLLNAEAGLPENGRNLTDEEAHGRLRAIGFRNPKGALAHIAALTSGLSRAATIQRNLLPVMVSWFSDGADPDYGLLSYRRIAERLGTTPWFLRMLRDSSGAALRLTRVLASSRYIGDLMEWIPESVAWLDNNEQLQPRSIAVLRAEVTAFQLRHLTEADRAKYLRALRRRETLRTAMGVVLGVQDIHQSAAALSAITDISIESALTAVRANLLTPENASLGFAVIGMGRLGGSELGFGSDADVLFVYEPGDLDAQAAQELAQAISVALREHLYDSRLPFELDADLRPEGRAGVLARSLDAYASYYSRWSLSWEAQALLRARPIAGDVRVIWNFMQMVGEIRYPQRLSDSNMREIKRIKARIESERLAQGVDPRRHLKLGPGTLSDVEWLVQMIQLQHAFTDNNLRTTATLEALAAARNADYLSDDAAQLLEQAWILSSRIRSAITLLTGRTSDIMPTQHDELDGIARLMGYPVHSVNTLYDEYLAVTRRARRVFETYFYG